MDYLYAELNIHVVAKYILFYSILYHIYIAPRFDNFVAGVVVIVVVVGVGVVKPSQNEDIVYIRVNIIDTFFLILAIDFDVLC